MISINNDKQQPLQQEQLFSLAYFEITFYRSKSSLATSYLTNKSKLELLQQQQLFKQK